MNEHDPAFRRSFKKGASLFRATTAVLILILLLLNTKANAQSLTLDWAFTMGSNTADGGKAMAVDVLGDVLVVGTFSGSMDADPGPDTLTLGVIGSSAGHAFILKLDASGQLLWAHAFGSVGGASGNAVTTDPAGNVYVTGSFSTTVDFDPGPGVYELVSTGFPDMFTLKLDVAGNFIWARSISTYDGTPANSVALDSDGNVLITGWFKSTADFDPGPGTDMHTSNGFEDIYVMKLDPMGNFLWAHTLGGWHTDKGASVATDPAGNVYVTGEYSYTVDFDPGTGVDTMTAYLSADMFVQKYDAAGNYLWTRTVGGHNGDYGRSLTIDPSGDVYVVGNFSGTSDLDPGPGTFVISPTGQWNSFILKLDDAGNFIWARSVQGGLNSANSITTDELGYTYIVGDFQETVDLDPGADSLLYTSQDLYDCYTMKLDPAGNLVWAAVVGGPGHDVGLGLAIDGTGGVYQTGWFYTAIDFDPSADTLWGYSQAPDLFVMKLHDLTTGLEEVSQIDRSVPYPNPTSAQVTMDLSGRDAISVKVYSVLGELLSEERVRGAIHSFRIEGPTGLYFVEVSSEDERTTYRVVKE